MYYREPRSPKAEDFKLIERMTHLAQLAIERKRAEEELKLTLNKLRALSDRLQQIREEERTRISRELHDNLGQALTALKIDLKWLAKKLSPQKPAIQKHLRSLTNLVDTTIESVQQISSELRIGILDDLGLAAALEWQAQEFQSKTKIRCDLKLQDFPGLDQSVSTAAFRIFQEALTNIARHSRAKRVAVHLLRQVGDLVLLIRDNGKGISSDNIASERSLGLIGMKERARALGGEVEIRGEARKGTTVTLRIPLRSRSKESSHENSHR